MSLIGLMPLGLGCLLLALLLWGVYTRRVCQRCDYCGRFYWWIGWAAFEWTSPACQYWTMRCALCRWLTQQLRTFHEDVVPPS
jgi:hypothetical protein